MKILQLAYSLASGGAERFVLDLCNQLAKDSDNEVVLLTTNDEHIPKNIHYLSSLTPNVRFINLHCPSGLHPLSFWRVLRTIQKEKPDVVHAHCNLLLLYLPTLFFCKSKYVHTLHSLAEQCLRYAWCKPINKWLYRHCVQAVTISPTCQRSYVELYKNDSAICVMNGREALIPTGVCPLKCIFVNDNASIFVHVARFSKAKNQQRLFKAFEHLQEEGINFHLIVLGAGYDTTEYARKYEGHPQIHLMGMQQNVADYVALADFFVLSSDWEGLPLSLLEAMSLGVVPISTPAGGIVDVIRDGENGYLSEGFDDENFYKKIKQAIAERGKISSESIKAEYERLYSMKTCATQYEKLYQNLIKNKNLQQAANFDTSTCQN